MTKKSTTILTCLFALLIGALNASTVDIPGVLPTPDNTPPASDQPVKVYILAGQSNMVGFGQLKGARPTYPSIYLSADPAILPCRMPVGPAALLPHGVYQSADANAPKGAKVSVYNGSFVAGADGSKKKPTKTTTAPLGTVAAQLPAINEDQTMVADAFIEVPMTGSYEIHVGHGESSNATATLNGKTVYNKTPGQEAELNRIELSRGKRYPISINYRQSGSAAFWLKRVDIPGKGDLTQLIKEGKFPWLGKAEPDDTIATWTVRNDVTYWETRISKKELGEGGPLSPESNMPGGKHMGPEVPFGYVVGTYHDEPVLLIESSMGNRSLNFDFRPPSSGRNEPDNHYEGYEYRAMIDGVRKTLKNIESIVPDYQGQGYEVVGFAWWQGHKDRGISKEEYEQHLVNLIKDVRKDLNAPDMRAVVATVAFDGEEMIPEYKEIHKAQMAVGDPYQHPEFAGQVKSVDALPYWRSQGESPRNVNYHYNFNAETYALTGDALGRAMVELLGGEVEEIAMPEALPTHPDVTRIYSNDIVRTYDYRAQAKYDTRSENPTDGGYAKMATALRPIILDGVIPDFIETAFSDESRSLRGGIELKDILSGERPKRQADSVQSQVDLLADYYSAVGIDDYQWKPFGSLKKNSEWYYHSFDPPEKQALDKTKRYRKVTFPEGMANWNAPDFNPASVGWKLGQAPFGQKDGKLLPRRESCYMPLCGCDEMPNTLWEKEVLLMQQTFDLPPAKEGHVYRVMLGGAGCDRSGEGLAVYINGKQLMQQDVGFMAREGIRGAYIYDDILPEFDGGKVTISVINFLRYTFHRNRVEYRGDPVPPNGHVSLWIEEAKIPEAVMQQANK